MLRHVTLNERNVYTRLTWLVPVTQFEGMKEVEELADRDFERLEESDLDEHAIASLLD